MNKFYKNNPMYLRGDIHLGSFKKDKSYHSGWDGSLRHILVGSFDYSRRSHKAAKKQKLLDEVESLKFNMAQLDAELERTMGRLENTEYMLDRKRDDFNSLERELRKALNENERKQQTSGVCAERLEALERVARAAKQACETKTREDVKEMRAALAALEPQRMPRS